MNKKLVTVILSLMLFAIILIFVGIHLTPQLNIQITDIPVQIVELQPVP